MIEHLASPSATIRLAAQQELLTRTDKAIPSQLLDRARDSRWSQEARVAALFTYAQFAGPGGIDALLELTSDSELAEFAVRAATDRLPWVEESDIPVRKITILLDEGSAREKDGGRDRPGPSGKGLCRRGAVAYSLPVS